MFVVKSSYEKTLKLSNKYSGVMTIILPSEMQLSGIINYKKKEILVLSANSSKL